MPPFAIIWWLRKNYNTLKTYWSAEAEIRSATSGKTDQFLAECVVRWAGICREVHKKIHISKKIVAFSGECWYNIFCCGVWRSLVARTAGGREVAGSNPVAPIKIKFSKIKSLERLHWTLFVCFLIAFDYLIAPVYCIYDFSVFSMISVLQFKFVYSLKATRSWVAFRL